MLLALETAIRGLLESALPALFTGASAVQLAFGDDAWTFDALSADPVAGEAGPEDAVDQLAFDPNAPAGPYTLTRPPYPGPKRVYLRSPAGELVALSPGELTWSSTDPRSFTFQPRAGRDVSAFSQVSVQYGVIAAGTQLKVLHRASLVFSAADAARAEQAVTLAIAVLALGRETLMQQGAFAFTSGGYQARGTIKTLAFSGGTTVATQRTLLLTAEVDLKVQRLLGEDEGTPILEIRSPGRAAGRRPVDIDPAVEA